MNVPLQLVLVGVARCLFEGAYHSVQIIQQCVI